ncbi:MAG TPA: hypothetical protein VI911_04195 [Patescibacteria group bacterium]|nr:hypothetical protein [Patescibacteria group bacterium]
MSSDHTHNTITSAEVHALHGGTPTGLKRQVFRSVFAGVDLFIGPNGAGKTTQGPLVLVTAQEGLAEKPTDTRRPYLGSTLPRDTGLTVTVRLPSREERSWTRDLGATRGNAKAEPDGQARTYLGHLPTAWDLSDFSSGTAGDRAKILDAAARAGGAIEAWDAKTAQAKVRAHILPALVDGEQASAREPAEVALTEATLETLDECIAALPTAATGADWLAAAKVWAEKAQADRNSAQKDKSAFAKEQGQKVPPKVDGDDAADRAEQDALLTERAASGQIEQARETAHAAIARHEAEGARLSKALDAALAEGKRLAEPLPPLDPDTRRAELEQAIADAVADTDAPIPAYDGQDPAALQVALAALRAQVPAADEAAEAAATSRNTARAAVVAAERARDEYRDNHVAPARQNLGTARATLSALTSLSGADDVCVHCGHADPRDVAGRLATARADLAAATTLRDGVEVRFDALVAAVLAARTAFEDARSADDTESNRRHDLGRDIRAAEQRLTDAQRATEGHEAAVRKARAATLARARADLERHTADRQRAEKRHADGVTQRALDLQAARERYKAAARAQKEHAALDAPTLPEPPDAARLAEIAAALAHIAIRTTARSVRAAAVESVRVALLDYEEAKLSWDASRAYVDAIRATTVQLAAVAYAPLQRAAQDLVQGADELPRPYFASPDDYGAIIRGRRVPYHGLSESEQRITAACLVYALAVVSAQPCRLVLLDGLDLVIRGPRTELLAALARAHSRGLVDNVVITMATSKIPRIAAEETAEVDIPGVTLHVLALPDLQPEPALEREPEHDGAASIDRPNDEVPFHPDDNDEVPF